MDEKGIVLIEWRDCEMGSGWYSRLSVDDYLAKPLGIVRSVGYLLHQDDQVVVIAGSLGENDEELACDLMKVPRAMIQSLTELEVNGKGANGRG